MGKPRRHFIHPPALPIRPVHANIVYLSAHRFGFALVLITAGAVGGYSLNRLHLIEVKAARLQKESLPGSYLTTHLESLAPT